MPAQMRQIALRGASSNPTTAEESVQMIEYLVAVGLAGRDVIQRLAGHQILFAELGLFVFRRQIPIRFYGVVRRFFPQFVCEFIQLLLRLLPLPGGIGTEGSIHFVRQSLLYEAA